MKKILLILAIFFSFAFGDGNMLLRSLEIFLDKKEASSTAELVKVGKVIGAIEAIQDINTMLPVNLKHVCLKDGVTKEQLARIVLKYAKENPQSLHYTHSSLSFIAIARAFPCK